MHDRTIRRTGIGILIVLGVVSAALVGCSAASTERTMDDDLRAVMERHALHIVGTAPQGITPLEVESVHDLRRLVASRANRSMATGTARDSLLVSSELPQRAATSVDTVEVHASYICNPLWRTRFNLWATIYRASSGSFHWIDSVGGVRVGLSGFRPFMDLTDTWTDVYIHPSGQRVTLSGGGMIDYYLYIKGWLVYYSEPASIVHLQSI